ncbi:hypothetical protein DAPPUDRAFT_121194 [Daphnia pulex]|uniref:Uncharacterized protein n=1 Tax=Daphnia pulex TaxID=6669 RepID=E9I2V1_DAPPU|nr:hypothetical protein DAPPUDRAFT_121194 [Daphnia pulex]|eukprot:EFX61679.1 hypothetical protein DAPPUDRAFT_121194 [Daphnia pulex]
MTNSALQGNVDGAEDIELLSSFKNMYHENKKANKLEKKYMRDILLDGIVVEINNNCEKHRASCENGNTVNENIVFYVCETFSSGTFPPLDVHDASVHPSHIYIQIEIFPMKTRQP